MNISYKPGKCLSCGAPKSDPKCSHCGQTAPLEHDSKICGCASCVQEREHMQDARDSALAASLLERMKKIKTEDESRRKEMGLPPPQRGAGNTIIMSSSRTLKKCMACGYLCDQSDKFCTNCGRKF